MRPADDPSVDARLPACAQLRDRLAARLASGEWGPDEALPSENRLAAGYALSVGTVRKAIGQLVAEGLLERRRGSGTYLRKPAVDGTLVRVFERRGADGRADGGVAPRAVQRDGGLTSRAGGTGSWHSPEEFPMSAPHTTESMLAKLVGFPTVSRDSNLELIHYVRDYLAGLGVESRIVPNADGTKANLYAMVGPAEPGGIVLSGHTDVVPVDGQPWTTDPFTLTEKDGRLYGRGACDMKGFDALVLAAVPKMQAAGLKRPVQIALSYDEEVGCLGAPSMIAEMRETLPPASAVVVGEPTMMEVVSRHKGVIRLEVSVRGYEVHSSLMHEGVSAVMAAARLVTWAEDRMLAAKAAAEAARDPVAQLFEPPYATWHVGQISGGTAPNITAKDCSFWLDIRTMPGEDQDAAIAAFAAEVARVEAAMKAVRPTTGISVRLNSKTPGCRKEPTGTAEAERLARALTGDNGEHVVAYGTEAGQFQEAGYSAIICGPGSIEQAHQADEYISREQLAAGERFIGRVIDRLSA